MAFCEFKKGDFVDRKAGSYRFPGVITGIDNEGACTVKLAGLGVKHIFYGQFLRRITKEEYDRISAVIKVALDTSNLATENHLPPNGGFSPSEK